ncbi:MAG TPA: hypothetical protein VGG41_03930 [Solirubrobacteraceae bacterium]|jgi:hypothetical protein
MTPDVLDRIGEQLEHAEHELWLTGPHERTHPSDTPRRGRRWLRGPLVAVIALVGVSGTMGGLALAGTFSGVTISPQAWVDGQRVTPEPAATPDQTASLAILRRPRVASDALPAYYAQTFTSTPAGGSEGVNVSLSRRAYGFPDGAEAWVVPGNNGTICLVAANPETIQNLAESGPQPHPRVPGQTDDVSCEPDATITTGWPLSYAYSSDNPGKFFTAGIVPDGVTQITIGSLGGNTTTFPVYDNVWMGDLPGVPDSETFSGPNGPVTQSWPATPPTPLPAACQAHQAEHRGGPC